MPKLRLPNSVENVVIFILAGTYQQAEAFAKQRGMSPGSYEFLSDVMMLMGLNEPTVVRYGTYYRRPDIQEMESQMKAIGALVSTETTSYKSRCCS